MLHLPEHASARIKQVLVANQQKVHHESCHGVYAVRERRHAKLQAAMEDVMTAIVRLVNDKKDHIPPVTSPAVLTFPFEITIAG